MVIYHGHMYPMPCHYFIDVDSCQFLCLAVLADSKEMNRHCHSIRDNPICVVFLTSLKQLWDEIHSYSFPFPFREFWLLQEA